MTYKPALQQFATLNVWGCTKQNISRLIMGHEYNSVITVFLQIQIL